MMNPRKFLQDIKNYAELVTGEDCIARIEIQPGDDAVQIAVVSDTLRYRQWRIPEGVNLTGDDLSDIYIEIAEDILKFFEGA